MFSFNAPVLAAPAIFNQPFRFTCRQCPQNARFNVAAAVGAPPFACTPFSNHLLCQCCLEAMPDRINDPLAPKQTCSMCFKAFCDLYWGCRKGGCKRCLLKFSDMRVSNECLNSLLNDNQYESQLLSDWMARERKTAQELFDECVQKLRDGEFRSAGVYRADVALDKIVCRECGLKLFGDLAYQYRQSIAESELFDKSHRRPDCHWGKNCRTQKHNQDHARRYNHICDQTK